MYKNIYASHMKAWKLTKDMPPITARPARHRARLDVTFLEEPPRLGRTSPQARPRAEFAMALSMAAVKLVSL
jgi:hypothetical protein